MAGATPRLALPYPVPGDTVDVPRDMQALATKLDTVTGAQVVTALPGSPADGDEVIYVADASTGTVWRLRYRAAASGPKWEFVGGSPWQSADYTNRASFSTANITTFIDLNGGSTPPYTIPFSGTWAIGALLVVAPLATGAFDATVSKNGAAFGNWKVRGQSGTGNSTFTLTLVDALGTWTAGEQAGLAGSTNNTPCNFAMLRSRFFVRPVAVQ